MLKFRQSKPGWSTEPKERMSYYLYFAGQNAIYSLISTFLSAYLMFQGVNLTRAATVLLIVKIWDAVNDAVFGAIFDSVHFNSGKKYLPWLRVSTVLIPITTVILFSIPASADDTIKLVWLAVGYILWDTAYTLCDVPIFGIITAMTENISERGTILSYMGIWSGIGYGFTYLFATVLVSEKVNLNFFIVSIIVAVFGFSTMMPASFRLKERIVSSSDDSFTLRRMFSYLFKNKYLLIYYLGLFFYSAAGVGGALTLFVSYYLFNNSLFALVVAALGVVPSFVFALVVPRLIRRFDKMVIYRTCAAFTLLLSIVIWLVGYGNIAVYIVLSVIRAVPVAITGIVMFMFTPDCAEYGKYTSGIEAKGITFSIQTFMAKLTGAVAGALGLFILGFKSTEWVSVKVDNFQQLEALGTVQTPHALNTLWFVYMMIPAIGCALALIIWSFYSLRDRDVQIMADCNTGKITREEAQQALSGKYE